MNVREWIAWVLPLTYFESKEKHGAWNYTTLIALLYAAMQRIEKWLHQFRSTLYVIWNSYKIETYTMPVPSVMTNCVVTQKMFWKPKHVSTLLLVHCKPKPCRAYRELPVSQFYPVMSTMSWWFSELIWFLLLCSPSTEDNFFGSHGTYIVAIGPVQTMFLCLTLEYTLHYSQKLKVK